MRADMAQRADRDFGAGRVDRDAAPVSVRDGHHVVHARESRQDFRPDTPHGIFHRGATHCTVVVMPRIFFVPTLFPHCRSLQMYNL